MSIIGLGARQGDGAGPIMLSRTGAGRCCGAQGASQKNVF